MKKIFLSSFLSFFITIAFAQKVDCKSVKNGNFKTISEGGTTKIIRKGSVHTEINEAANFNAEFKVVWLNDCSYTLQPRKIISKGKLEDINKDDILTVKITAVTDAYYSFIATHSRYEGSVEGKVYFDR